LGYKPEVLAGVNIFTYIHAEDETFIRETITRTLQEPGIANAMKFRMRSVEGEWRVLEASSTIFFEEEKATRVVLNARDVTESEAQSAAFKHQSLHDALTGLPNRSRFHDFLAEAIRVAQERGKRLTLLYMDLDRFREINDTFGYRWGDTILQQVGPRL